VRDAIVCQLPHTHLKSLLRFSDEVISAFTQRSGGLAI